MLPNPPTEFYPRDLNTEHILSFNTARPWEVVSAAKFAGGIIGQNVYVSLVNPVAGELNYIHCSAYSV